MKQMIILLLILSTAAAKAQIENLPERPRILIWGSEEKEKNKNAEQTNSWLPMFEDLVEHQIRLEFPCADIRTFNTIRAMMANDRERVLMTNGESNMDVIAGGLGCDIMINLAIKQVGDNLFFEGTTFDMRSSKSVNKQIKQVEKNKLFQEQKKFGDDLIKDLMLMEICSYKGEITVSTVTTFKDKQERSGLPGQDCEFQATREEEKLTENTWIFQKTKRIKGTSTVKYIINNYKKEFEHNNCSPCLKMENNVKTDIPEANKTDKKTTSETTETYLANKTAPIQYLDERYSAWIKIKFEPLKNQYSILLEAATQPVKWHMQNTITNSGCPYDENYENEMGAIISKKIERTLGPYPGSPYQKNLRQKVTTTTIDPDSNGKGKTVETISFNLSR